MSASLQFDLQTLSGFLLTLTRVGAALILLPMPGFQNTNQVARIVLIVGSTLCLFPVWSTVAQTDGPLGLVGGALLETTIGLLLGLSMAFVFESFQIGAQLISMQAGFSFATTIDPQSQADAGLLPILAQLTSGWIFFSLGIHAQLLRMLARSFGAFSLESVHAGDLSVSLILHLGSKMLADGLKLALPVVVLLFLVDVGLTALTRLQAQLQLMTLVFPAKILLGLVFLAVIVARWPGLFSKMTTETFTYVFRLLAI